MARVSRKTNNMPAEDHSVPCAEILYNTALYARLSIVDTRDRKDSESLETQTELLKKYISDKPDMSLYGCYKDNGETGTNFQRPEFMRMMEDVRAGRVNCIVVKDLSRFGRDFQFS